MELRPCWANRLLRDRHAGLTIKLPSEVECCGEEAGAAENAADVSDAEPPSGAFGRHHAGTLTRPPALPRFQLGNSNSTTIQPGENSSPQALLIPAYNGRPCIILDRSTVFAQLWLTSSDRRERGRPHGKV